MRWFVVVVIIACAHAMQAQVHQFPYRENFDTVIAPSLPSGWITSTNRTPSGDFTTTTSAPRSSPNCVLSTNATISQYLTTPVLDFTGWKVDSLIYFERRSSSHNSGVLIEASIDRGNSYTIRIGDTLRNPGTTSYVERRFKLPDSLDNQSSVRIRWLVRGDGTGTSGTIRFDDLTITARARIDATISRIHFLPQYPVTGDSVEIVATLENSGTEPIQDITVEFYDDADGDSLPQPEEMFASVVVDQSIPPDDSAVVAATRGNLDFGSHTIIAKSILSGDQNALNDVRHAVLIVGLPPYSVVINEIMYAPVSPEPEWIELYNTTADAIELKGWHLSNRNSTTRYILTNSSFILEPNGYCVVMKNSTDFVPNHPSVNNILQAPSLPTFLFNNNGDAVVLFDSRGRVMDSVRYFTTWGGTDGKSLERIEASRSSNDPMNWGTSGDSSGSTPGVQNFLTPLEHNLRVLRVSALNASSETTTVLVTVRNIGRQPVGGFTVSLYFDADEDSIPQPSELVEQQSISSTLVPNDSTSVQFLWLSHGWGWKLMIAMVEHPQDMRSSDNIVVSEIGIAAQPRALVINEIMYEPLTGDAEYIELYNRSGAPVDIRDWRLADIYDTSTSSTKYVISDSLLVIGVRDYLVVAADSSIFNRFAYLRDSIYHVVVKSSCVSLNNDGDDVVLCDLTNQMIDSLHYLPSWHNAELDNVAGRALERINPDLSSNDLRNWSTSANPLGGTPGKQNSLYTVSIPTDVTLSFSPNPFSPDGDGFEDVTIVSYQLPAATALIRVRIYDAKGRLVRTLANSEPSGSRGEIIWDGFNDDRERVRMGIYVVLLEALDANGGSMQTTKGVVVVAAKL